MYDTFNYSGYLNEKKDFFLIMWPSPFKLFLDTESEEDVVRNRAASSSEDGNSTASGADGGHQAEDDTSICHAILNHRCRVKQGLYEIKRDLTLLLARQLRDVCRQKVSTWSGHGSAD